MEKIISPQTIKAIAASLGELSLKQDRAFSIVLHGGEPFLMGPAKLEFLLKTLRTALSAEFPISIQTNGILITEQILDICSFYHASVAISLDGPRETNDKYRISHKNTGTFDGVLKGLDKVKNHSDSAFLDAGLLAVIDVTSNPAEVYHFFKELAPPSVDFLYKDGNHTNLPLGKKSLNSTEYGQWMVGLLVAYLSDPEPLPIRVLDDMMKVLLGGIVSKEGMGITDFGIIIIDTDGTIMKNDTLKSTYNGADKFAKPVNIKDGTLLEFLNSEPFQQYRKMQKPSASECLNCPALNICGGGMILHRWKKENGFDNPSVYCADQLHLISSMREIIVKQLENANIT